MKKHQTEQLQLPSYARGEKRFFSEEARRSIVKDLDAGLIGVKDASRLYQVSVSALYKWLVKYSPLYQKKLVQVVEHESESQKRKALEDRVRQLEQALGRKALELDYLEKVLELASEAFGEDIKKKFATPPSCTFTDKANRE